MIWVPLSPPPQVLCLGQCVGLSADLGSLLSLQTPWLRAKLWGCPLLMLLWGHWTGEKVPSEGCAPVAERRVWGTEARVSSPVL